MDEDVTLDNLADFVDRETEDGSVAVEAPAQAEPASTQQTPTPPVETDEVREPEATPEATQTPAPTWSWDTPLPTDDPSLPPELRGKPLRELLNDRDKAVREKHYAGFEKNGLAEQVKILRHALDKFGPSPTPPPEQTPDAYTRNGVDPDIDLGGQSRKVLNATAEDAADRLKPALSKIEQQIQSIEQRNAAQEQSRIKAAGKQAWETGLKEIQKTAPTVSEDWFKENTRLLTNVIMAHRAELYQTDESGQLVRDEGGNPVIDWRHPDAWKANPLDTRAWVNAFNAYNEGFRKLNPQPATTEVTAEAATPQNGGQTPQAQLTSPPPTGITRPTGLSSAPTNPKLNVHQRNALNDIFDGYGDALSPEARKELEADIADGRY